MTTPTLPDPARLLAHRAFVRHVVRRLVRDDATADDVVQETWVRALRSPPRMGRALRGWLARVGKNVALDRLRSERRRRRREQEAARAEGSVASPGELAERVARQREVAGAVLALDEPLRSTVILRYYEDQPPRRIAAAHDVPVATVKSRLRRAFELLRAQLDNEYGSRDVWQRSLLPLAGSLGRLGWGATGGGLLVKKKLILAVTALALGTTGVLFWHAFREDGAERSKTRRAAERGAGAHADRATGAAGSRKDRGFADNTAAKDRPPPPHKTAVEIALAEGLANLKGKTRRNKKNVTARRPYRVAEVAGPADRALLRVLVFDGLARPILGADVRLFLVVKGVGKTGSRGKTDASGTVRFDDLLADELASVSVTVERFTRTARVRLADGHVTELSVTFEHGLEVSGIVRNARYGPLAYISVSFTRKTDDGFTDRTFANTDTRGRYELPRVPAGEYEVQLAGGRVPATVRRSPGGAPVNKPRVQPALAYHEKKPGKATIAPPGPVTHDIILGHVAIEGTVRDGATGRPIAGATVQAQSPHFAIVKTDARGRFTLASLPPGKYRFLLEKDGYVLRFVRDVEIGAPAAGPLRRDFSLHPAATLHLMLRDKDGHPVRGEHWITFSVGGKDSQAGDKKREWTSNLTADADGRIVSKTAPLGTITLSISGGGWTGGPVTVDAKPGTNTVPIVLERMKGKDALSLRGIVRNETTRAPVKGARVRLSADMMRDAYTDAEGGYEFKGVPAGRYRLSTEKDGYANLSGISVRIEDGQAATRDLKLTPAATLHIRVTDEHDRPVSGKLLLAYTRKDEGLGRGIKIETDADGRATCRRLAPGKYSYFTIVAGERKSGYVPFELRLGDNTLNIRLKPPE